MRESQPDIVFASSLRAASLHFGHVPEVNVGFSGAPGRDSVTTSVRTNLSDPVAADVDYQNVEVHYAFKNSVRTRP